MRFSASWIARTSGLNLALYRASKFKNQLTPKRSSVEWHVNEGAALIPITHCATVKGPVRKILLGERVALNILARCSGIATK